MEAVLYWERIEMCTICENRDCFYDNYSLPIRVLKSFVFDVFEQMKNGVGIEKSLFENTPVNYHYTSNIDLGINENNEIDVSEKQCQLLWNCAYALSLCEEYYCDGQINRDIFVKRVFDLLSFEYSDSEQDGNSAYMLPNPCHYCLLESQFVERANLYYRNAMRFVLYHELSHIIQNNQHSTKDIVEAEKEADIYAVNRLCKDYVMNSIHIEGVEASMLYFLTLQKGKIDGDVSHGNVMDRFQIIAEQFDNKGLFSCIKWQVVIAIWNKLNNYGFVIPTDSSLKSLKNVIYLIKRKFINN